MTDHNLQPNWLSLIEKFVDNTCTREEFDVIMAKIERESDKEGLSQILKTLWEKSRDRKDDIKVDWEAKFAELMEEAKTQDRAFPIEKFHRKYKIGRWAAAAAVLILLSAGSYFLFDRKAPDVIAAKESGTKGVMNGIAPGRNTATLTLADGSVVVLDSAENGTLTSQGDVKVIKISDGLLSFNAPSSNPKEAVYNTISTPRGGQYQIELADGTKVWLNAASSLKFPTAFIGNERTVVMSGEGYFEVAKDKKMPFNVIANGIRIDVLGTHFNVNAYSDENTIATTLLEGSLKVTNQAIAGKRSQSLIIKPGQQAKLTSEREIELVNDVDVEQAVAWKNGQFQFDNQDIGTIMRQVSRWYDVDVVYRGPVPQRFFTGKISRSSNASQVIRMLEYAGVNVSLVGKNIVVVP